MSPSGRPSGRGDYNIVTDPTRFISHDVLKLSTKDTRAQIKVYENESNSSGSPVYSDAIRIAPAEGYTVYIQGTGDVLVQTCISPTYGSWFTQQTITDSGVYTTKQPERWLRIGLADSVSLMSVWVYRKYATY